MRENAWVINQSLGASGVRDPLLARRVELERVQIDRVRRGLAERVYVVPWLTEAPRGIERLRRVALGQGAMLASP